MPFTFISRASAKIDKIPRLMAKSNNIELWDRDKLIDFLSKARGKQLAEEFVKSSKPEEQLCPRCGNVLVLRNGRRGKFWGCRSFPRCRFTKSYSGFEP